MTKKLRVAIFPYGLSQENPYQNLIIKGLETAGLEVVKIPGRKLFPLLLLKKAKPDVVHIFWPHDLYIGKNKAAQIFKQWSLRLTLPILRKFTTVYSAENISSHNVGSMSVTEEVKWISKILSNSKGILFMSNAAAEVFHTHYTIVPEKRFIIPHVSYTTVYENTVSKADARVKLGLNATTVYLILGRLQPYKGIEQSIAAFKQLNLPDTQLLIAGKSISKDYLIQLQAEAGDYLNERIKIIDTFIPNNEIQYYVNGASYLIINYKDVPLNPGSIIMAKDFGIPIIANSHPVIEEVCGSLPHYFFMAGDVASLTQAMLTAYHKGSDLTRIPVQVPDNRPEIIGQQLYQFYQQLQP